MPPRVEDGGAQRLPAQRDRGGGLAPAAVPAVVDVVVEGADVEPVAAGSQALGDGPGVSA